LQTSGLVGDADWLPLPLSQRYPVSVLGVTVPKLSDGSARVEALVVWQGADGEIAVGDLIDAVDITQGVVPARATVVAVAEATDRPVAATSATGFELVAAVAILGFIAYALKRTKETVWTSQP
jgi:hypothetical protein